MSGWIYVFMLFAIVIWTLWYVVKGTDSAEQAAHMARMWQQGREACTRQAVDRAHFEVTGTIRWFDAAKGYGFIATDAGMRDVLLPLACLRASGYRTAHKGARIHCEASRRRGMFQAFRVLSLEAANEP